MLQHWYLTASVSKGLFCFSVFLFCSSSGIVITAVTDQGAVPAQLLGRGGHRSRPVTAKACYNLCLRACYNALCAPCLAQLQRIFQKSSMPSVDSNTKVCYHVFFTDDGGAVSHFLRDCPEPHCGPHKIPENNLSTFIYLIIPLG